MVMSVLY